MKSLLTMAIRDLARNRRRSLLSALALGMGVALLLLMAAVVRGEMRDAIESSIRLQSGHMQVQGNQYDPDKNSLAWEDLIADPGQITSVLSQQPEVVAATPRLIASAIIQDGNESNGVQLLGIETDSSASAPYKDGLVDGTFITPDDRDSLMIGQELARKLDLKVGDTIHLSVNTADGTINEQNFTIKGIFTTKVPAFDQATVMLPLAKAQAITGTENHASIIFVMLKNRDLADGLKARLHSEQFKIKTWLELNSVVVETEKFSNAYMYVLYLIVLGVTATVIVNTLVMSVFERTREIGILTAVGMRSSSIMGMFLIESCMLAGMGILMGLGLGALFVLYSTKVGFYIGNMGVTGMMLGERIYGYLTAADAIPLVLVSLFITLIASLYPAILASRMEPVEALHGGKVA
jgi:ABC-type lipoprotein release transport system permease subunit